jgi:predicted trehalose synthase
MIMSFVSRSVLAVALLTAWPAAHACDVGNQKVEKVLGKKVATYTENGDFRKEIEASAVQVNAPLVECRDTPALVRVKTMKGESVWVDRLDVKIAGATKTVAKCKSNVVSRESDTRAPAASGIDPCSG